MKLNRLALLLLFCCSPLAFGQADQGTITGVIQDPTGALIGNAAVTLRNVDTGQTLKGSSDGSGVLSFRRSRSATTALPPPWPALTP